MRHRTAVSAVLVLLLTPFLFLVGCSDDEASPVAPPAHRHEAAALAVTPAGATLAVGEALAPAATVSCACGAEMEAPVAWRSEDPSVARWDASAGLFRALAPGTTDLVARSHDFEEATVLEVTGELVATVGPEGGEVVSPDGGLSLSVPAGALAEATELRIARAADDGLAAEGRYVPGTAYDCRPDGLQLRERARLRIRYDPGHLPEGVRPERLRIHQRERLHDGSGQGPQFRWRQMEQARVRAGERVVEAEIGHFSTYAVLAPPPAEGQVATVSASAGQSVLEVGAELRLTAVARDADGRRLDVAFDWTVDDASVAVVRPEYRQTALVEGRAEGPVAVTATAGAASASVRLQVTGPRAVGSIAISPAAAELRVGETVAFTAEVLDEDGRTLDRTVSWSSSAPMVADVDRNGRATAVGRGDATVTARTGGLEVTAGVTVVPGQKGKVEEVVVSPASVDIEAGETVFLEATVLDEEGDVLQEAVSWHSSDATVARVDDGGRVTGIDEGTAMISAVAGNVSGSSRVGVARQGSGGPGGGTPGGPGGGTPGGGSGKGDLYADLVYLYRSADGLPILRSLAGESCLQPVSYTAVAGVSPVTNPLNGEDVWLLPLVGETMTASAAFAPSMAAEDDDHEDEDELEACDVQPAYATYVREVEIGRLNMGRAPDKVIDRALGEVRLKLDAAVEVHLDHAGRLAPDDVPIDAPAENLAIMREMVLHGRLDSYALPAPPAYRGYLEHAASGLAAGADKFGRINADLVVYHDRVLDLPSQASGGLSTLTGDGQVGEAGTKYLNYRGFTYHRAATFPGCVIGFRLVGGEMVRFQGTLMDEVFGGQDLTAGNVHGYARRADDARAVILFEHDTVIQTIDRIGEDAVCVANDIQ